MARNKYLNSLDKITFDNDETITENNNNCTCRTQPTCDWCDDTDAE